MTDTFFGQWSVKTSRSIGSYLVAPDTSRLFPRDDRRVSGLKDMPNPGLYRFARHRVARKMRLITWKRVSSELKSPVDSLFTIAIVNCGGG